MALSYKLTAINGGQDFIISFPVAGQGIHNISMQPSSLSAFDFVDNQAAITVFFPKESNDYYAETREFIFGWGFQCLNNTCNGYNSLTNSSFATSYGFQNIAGGVNRAYSANNGQILEYDATTDEWYIYPNMAAYEQHAWVWHGALWSGSETSILLLREGMSLSDWGQNSIFELFEGEFGLPEPSMEGIFPNQMKWDYVGNVGGFGQIGEAWGRLLTGATPEIEIDPFEPDPQPDPSPGGYTPPGGDNVPEPALPPVSVTDTGFVTLFNPSQSQLKNLANYLWSPAFSLESFKKMFADPMDCILSLKLLPCNVPNTQVRPVTVGNISTGINMAVAGTQFVNVDFGSIYLSRNTFSYLDWSPFTKVSLWLPFLGERQLDTNEVMGKNIRVKYHIDILSGDGVAFILVNGSVYCQFDCHCAVDVPISGQNTTNTMLGALSLVSQGTMAIASGGASMIGALPAAASTVAGMKPQVQHSGNMAGSSGILSVRYPVLIVSRPKICAPAKQSKYTGYPLYKTKKLINASGFTKIYEVHLDGIPCTDEEKDMLNDLLRKGVIL